MEPSNEIADLLRQIRNDLQAVRNHTRRLARGSYLEDLRRVASTPQRQEIWRLSDGTRTTQEIASLIGVSLRAVQYFVDDSQKLGLIVALKRGYPKRTEDFNEIPVDWAPYRKSVTPTDEAEKPELPNINEGEREGAD